MIGTVAGVTMYEVSFDAVRDAGSAGKTDEAVLLAYSSGAARNDSRSDGTAIRLGTVLSNVTTNGLFDRVDLPRNRPGRCSRRGA